MSGPTTDPPSGPGAALGRLAERYLLRRGQLTRLLLVTAYVTAVVGLGLSLLAEPAGGRTAGIVLMFVAFACLFVATLRILDTVGSEGSPDGGAGRHRR